MELSSIKKLFRNAQYQQIIDEITNMKGEPPFFYQVALALAYSENGEINRGFDIIDKLMFENRENKELHFVAGSVKARFIVSEGRINDAEELTTSLLTDLAKMQISEKTDVEIRIWIAHLYNTIGNMKFRKSLVWEAIEFHQKSLQIRKQIGDPYYIASSYGNIAIAYNHIRRFKEALEYYEHSLQYFNDGGYTYETRITFNNIGVLYLDQGRLDKAEEMINISIKISQEYNDERLLSFAQNNMGSILRSKNNLDGAMKFYLESLELRRARNNPIELLYSYYYLFLTSIDKGDFELAEVYLNDLEDLNKVFPNSINLEVTIDLCQAIILKNSVRTRQKAQAHDILEKIIHNEEFMDVELKILARLNLCEMLLMELKSKEQHNLSVDEEDEIIDEVQMHVGEMQKLAEIEGYSNLMIEVKIIEAYLHLSKLNMEQANNAILTAKSISEDLGVVNFLMQFPELDSKDSKVHPKIGEDRIYSSGKLEFQKSINSIIHSLPRLQIILYLAEQPYATFSELKDALGFSPGNLGKHCDKLVEVGYISKNKNFVDNRFLTQYELTSLGLQEFKKYAETFQMRLNSIAI